MRNVILLTILTVAHTFPLCAGAAAREGKAVNEISPELGFRLTEAARKNVGLQIQALKGTGPWGVPASAIVHYQDHVGVYRERDGWFKLVEVKVVSESGKQRVISSTELLNADAVVTADAGLLRVAEMDAFGSEE
jgi:hypothetical protein